MLLWKRRAIFSMVLEGGHFGKETSCKRHRILHGIFWGESMYYFVECLIIFVSHFLKNKNRYLHYMKKIYAKNFQVYMHWHWSSSEKFSFSKPIASMFCALSMIAFSYGAEICPPLVQVIGHVSAFNRYIEM